MADKKISMGDLQQEKADIENLKMHLEEEYRKADISERNYEELRQKYDDRIAEIDRMLEEGGVAPSQPREKVDSKEETDEGGKEAEQAEEPQPEQKDDGEKKKGGLFSKLSFGKKKEADGGDESDPAVAAAKAAEEEAKKGGKKKDEGEPDLDGLDPSSPEAIEKLAAQLAGQSGAAPSSSGQDEAASSSDDSGSPKDIEVEKLKVIIDSIREAQKSTDDSVRSLAESIGEMRSMVFTEDSSLKEEASKVERLEDDVAGVKPKEIEAKFREFSTKMEQNEINMEKFQRKSDDLAEKVNKAYEMLKGIGGVENLISINKDVQGKVDDIREALKYTERLALKTERIFIDLNKDIQDIVIYKTRQEGLEESVKEMIKSMDGLNARMNELMTKKDLDTVREDVMVLQRQMEEFNKALPIVDSKMPETIALLRNERNNVLLFMDTLKEHFRSGIINAVEFEDAKRKNMAKLAKIESDLKQEWRNFQAMVQSGAMQKEDAPSDGVGQADQTGTAEPSGAPAPQEGGPEPAKDAAVESKEGHDEQVPEEKDAETDEAAGQEDGRGRRKQAAKKPANGDRTQARHRKESGPENHGAAKASHKDAAHAAKKGPSAKVADKRAAAGTGPVEHAAKASPARKEAADFVSQVAQRLEAGGAAEPGKMKSIVGRITSTVSEKVNQPEPGLPIVSDMTEVDEGSKKEEMGSILKKVKEKMA